MMELLARTGRKRQLYENHLRLVAGCIPYRFKPCPENHNGDMMDRLEVVMISTPNRHDLVFPKGGWENDETVDEAACREALEEAGVSGIISEKELGTWVFKSKSKQSSCGLEGSCKGYIFALEVTQELDFWPEQDLHTRRWLSPKEAHELCRYDWMREALGAFLRYLACESVLMASTEISERPSCLVNPARPIDSAIDTYSSRFLAVLRWLSLEWLLNLWCQD